MTILESLVAVMIVSIGFGAIVTMLSVDIVCNDLEQERARAHQMVCQAMEMNIKMPLYPQITGGQAVTVWDNGTPDNPNDDTTGIMEVILRNPKTGAKLTAAPIPAVRVQIEVTLSWHPRGRLSDKTFRETAMTYRTP